MMVKKQVALVGLISSVVLLGQSCSVLGQSINEKKNVRGGRDAEGQQHEDSASSIHVIRSSQTVLGGLKAVGPAPQSPEELLQKHYSKGMTSKPSKPLPSVMTHTELASGHQAVLEEEKQRNDKNRQRNRGRILTKDIKPHALCHAPNKQYIVTCKDETVEQECREELEEEGVEITHMVHGTKFFGVCIDSEKEYQVLMELADVDALEEDVERHFMVHSEESTVHRKLGQSIPYGIELVNAVEFWNNYNGSGGEGVKVCVIDTGLDGNHEDLQGPYDVDGSNDGDLVYPWNEDGDGHGTHCGGTIGARNNNIGAVGVAPNVDLFIARGTFQQEDISSFHHHSLLSIVDWRSLTFSFYPPPSPLTSIYYQFNRHQKSL